MPKTTYDNRPGKDDKVRKHRIDDTERVRKIILGLRRQRQMCIRDRDYPWP